MDAQGRLTFPRSLAVAGKPTCMCLGDLKGDGKVEVLYVSKQERDYSVRVLTPRERGAFEERLRIPLEDVRAEPDGILCADANGDGKPDVLLFIPYQEMRILKATADGRYTDVSRGADYGKGLVQGARLKSVAVADVNGDGKPEILMASKNFARALRLDEKDRLQIVDQFNGRSPTSQIVGVAAVSLNGDPAPEIVLVDVSNRCLTALKRSAVGAYEIAENLQTGPVAFERIIAADLGGAGKPALVLVGQNDFSILQPGRSKTVLREVASYETAIRNGRLEGIAVGKLDPKEKRPQILVTEATKNVMEVISWTDDGRSLKRVLSWPIFEARSFPGPRGSGGGHGPQPAEPREFDVGDLTNDGKPDLVLLVHDRVLVYPQE
jgi:hypothetical protein